MTKSKANSMTKRSGAGRKTRSITRRKINYLLIGLGVKKSQHEKDVRRVYGDEFYENWHIDDLDAQIKWSKHGCCIALNLENPRVRRELAQKMCEFNEVCKGSKK